MEDAKNHETQHYKNLCEIQIKYINGEIKKEEFETQCKIENLRYISVLTERTLQMQTEIENQKRMSAMLDKVWGHE